MKYERIKSLYGIAVLFDDGRLYCLHATPLGDGNQRVLQFEQFPAFICQEGFSHFSIDRFFLFGIDMHDNTLNGALCDPDEPDYGNVQLFENMLRQKVKSKQTEGILNRDSALEEKKEDPLSDNSLF